MNALHSRRVQGQQEEIKGHYLDIYSSKEKMESSSGKDERQTNLVAKMDFLSNSEDNDFDDEVLRR